MSRVSSLSSPLHLGFEEIERTRDRVGNAADGYLPCNIGRLACSDRQPERPRATIAVAGFERAGSKSRRTRIARRTGVPDR
jgi:hypothetical protein